MLSTFTSGLINKMPTNPYRTSKEEPNTLSAWDKSRFGLIIIILGALIPVIDSISNLYFSLFLFKDFAQPDTVKNAIQLGTILAGLVFILVSVSIPVPRRRRPGQIAWRPIGLGAVFLVWVTAMILIIRLAPRVDNAETFQKFPSMFTPLDTSRGWITYVVFQNIGNDLSDVSYIINDNGNELRTSRNGLAPAESWLVSTADVPGRPSEEFLPGGYMASSQPGSALVINVGWERDNPASQLRLSYTGQASGSKKLYFPAVKNDYYGVTTSYWIQNTGKEATRFRAQFLMENNKPYQFTSRELRPNESIRMELSDAKIPLSEDIKGKLGTLIVEANQPIVASIMEHATGDVKTEYTFTTAQAAGDAYERAYIPERGVGQHINLQVINTESHAIDLKVSYGQSASAPDCDEKTVNLPTRRIESNSSVLIPQDAIQSGGQCRLWANLEGTGKFLVFVSETNYDEKSIISLSYGAHSTDSLTPNLAFPWFSDGYKGIITTLEVRNPDPKNEVKFKGTFHCTGEDEKTFVLNTKTITLEPFGGYAFKGLSNFDQSFETGQSILPNAWCSAIIEGGGPIVGFVRESSEQVEVTTRVDYDAMNLPSSPTIKPNK